MYEGRDSEHRGRRVVALDFPRHSCRAAQRQAGHRIGVLGDHRDVPCRRGTQSSVQEVKRTRPCKQYPGSFVFLGFRFLLFCLLLCCCLLAVCLSLPGKRNGKAGV
jgi:hypothetical protein